MFTSFIVLVVSTGRLHGHTAAGAPPTGLAFAVPALLAHGALAVPVAQVRTTICEGEDMRTKRGGGVEVRGSSKEEETIREESCDVCTSYLHPQTHRKRPVLLTQND